MSRNRFIFIFSLLCVLFYFNFFCRQTSIKNEEEKQIQLQSYLHFIKDSDFSFLMNELQNKRIVVLGEQQHQDGTTFLQKEQIIRYLHENLNYEVVLYEAGLYDMWLMANNIGFLNPATGLYPFWWDNEESKNLWEYYRTENQLKDSIYLGGFDIQLTGNIPDSARINRLMDYLNQRKICFNHSSLLLRFLRYMLPRNKFDAQFTREQQDSIVVEMGNLATDIQQIDNPNIEDKIYCRYLSGLKQRFESVIEYPEIGHPQRMQVRDSLMADNLIWLADSVYPNKKIIVWIANIHAIHPEDSSRYFSWKTMGQYLKGHYKDSLYTVVFSSFGRLNTKGNLYKKLGNKSLEYLIHNTAGIPFAYIQSNEVNSSSFMNQEFVTGINQGLNMNAKWLSMFDLYIYIDTMKSITPLKK